MRRFALIALLALGLGALAVHAQSPLLDNPGRSILKGAAVQYLYPEQITVPANKPSPVELHFRVASGLHINSHTPHDAYLIPTTLQVPASSGVRLVGATFPDGEDFTLPADPKTRLSVYTGNFTVFARIQAERGNHLVQARLRYQACDNNECMPPKNLTVAIDVIAK